MQDEVFLTGAGGFVGSHVLLALREHGYTVRALVRGRSSLPVADVVTVRGDVRRPGELVDAMRGCRHLVHTAALYSFTPGDRHDIMAVNVAGTVGLLEAARLAGVERAVVTSSSAAVGHARGAEPATEADWGDAHHAASAYHTSKILQERAALAARMPVVTVLPTAPIGAGDSRPTPTGRMVVDVIRGRIRATLAGGMNIVDVDDVALAHVLALQRGRPGERYIAGGVNLTLAELWRLIAGAAHRRAPRVRMPYAIAAAAGLFDEARCRLTGAVPRVPLEGVRLGRQRMYVSSAKSESELGYRASAVEPAIARAVDWFRANGYAA